MIVLSEVQNLQNMQYFPGQICSHFFELQRTNFMHISEIRQTAIVLSYALLELNECNARQLEFLFKI